MAGPAGDDHKMTSVRKNMMAMRAPAAKAECVIDQPVALHRIADLKLHHRHSGEASREPGASKIIADCFLKSRR